MKLLLCKLGIHYYKYKFIAYADQPFENDDLCVTEGYHTYKCKSCGKEKPYFKF